MLYSLDTVGSLELSIEARKLTACNQGNVLRSLFSSSRTVIIRGGDYVLPVQVFPQIDPRPANAMKNAVWLRGDAPYFCFVFNLFFLSFFITPDRWILDTSFLSFCLERRKKGESFVRSLLKRFHWGGSLLCQFFVKNIRSSHKFVRFFERLYMLRSFTYLSVSWKNVIPLSMYNFFPFFKCIGPLSLYVYKSTHEMYTQKSARTYEMT